MGHSEPSGYLDFAKASVAPIKHPIIEIKVYVLGYVWSVTGNDLQGSTTIGIFRHVGTYIIRLAHPRETIVPKTRWHPSF
jgi:hypothetical protein